MLNAWRAQKWLLWPCSVKVPTVKNTLCSSRDLTWLSCIVKVLLPALSLSIQLLIAVPIDYYSWVSSVPIDYYSWVPFISLSLSILTYGYLLYIQQWKQPTKENKPQTELDSVTTKSPIITSQPTNQNDVLPRKTVLFSVQATGTELTYQWQWKQFGKEGNKDGWQNLSDGSSTFQVKDVKANKAGYYRCVVSNSTGSDTSQCASLTVAAEVADLVNELQDVSEWWNFGLNLGIEMPRLEAIQVDCPTLGERRIQMLNEWQKKVTPTWPAVVQALEKIGLRRRASELAQKYGALEPPSTLPDTDPLNQLKCNQDAKEQIQKLREDLEQEHRKLVNAEECLRQSQESKAKANEKMSTAMVELEEARKNVEKISQEKSDLENNLKIKELEQQVLSERIQAKDAYNQILQHKIDKKGKKIKSLKREIQEKESELRVALQEVISRQEELSEAQKELKKQHEEVIRLQREKEELACSYNIGKEHFSKIVQLLLCQSDKEEMQQQLTSMKEESERNSQQIKDCNADITHLSEEIKTLSSSLQVKEAVAAQLRSELEKGEQVASTQQLGFIELRVAKLERRFQEVEEQKQKAELGRDAIVQEMKSRENLAAQFHAKLDDPPVVMNHPNYAGSLVSEPAQLTVADPRVGSHPQELEDVDSGEQDEMIQQCRQFMFPDKSLDVMCWPLLEAVGYSFLPEFSQKEEDCVMLQCKEKSQLCLVSYNCISKQIKAHITIPMKKIQEIYVGSWKKSPSSYEPPYMRIFYTSTEDKMYHFTLGPRTMTYTTMDEQKKFLMKIVESLLCVQPSIKFSQQKIKRKRSPSHPDVVVV